MLQNILEQEDFIKGLPDEALYRAMEQPSGEPPQFLILSEIQRRTDMRERYAATQEQPQGTISEQIISEGLGGMSPMGAPPQAMGSPIPPDSAFQPLPAVAAAGGLPPPTGGMALGSSGLAGMGGQPQGMSSGGIVGMSNGGGLGSYPYEVGDPNYNPYYDPASDVYGTAEPLSHTFRGVGPWMDRNREQSRKLRELIEKIKYEQGVGFKEAEAQATAILDMEEGEEQVDPPGILSESVSGAEVDPDSGASTNSDSIQQSYWDLLSQGELGESLLETSGTDEPVEDITPETDQQRLLRELDALVPIDSGIDGQTAPSTFTPSAVHHGDEYLDRVMDRYGDIRTGAEGRLDTRRTQSQDLIEQIREEGRRDAFSAAMMQLGAGVAGGDMAAGLQRAGEAATSINALARDAARAEGRGLRDYEESTLSMIDQLGMQEAEFEYGEQKEEAVRAQEQARWEADHGIRDQSLQLERQWRDAGLEIQYATLKSNQMLKVTEIAAKAKSDLALTRREAMRLFSNYMGDIQDIAEDMPRSGTSEEDKMALIHGMRKQILDALAVDLGPGFLEAFEKEAEAVGDLEGEALVDAYLSEGQ
jgi:hypothetical protein